jgi:outer membrane protein assembly factor BamD
MGKFRIGRILAGVALVASISLGGCGDDDKNRYKDQTVEVLYNAAVDKMEKESWTEAGKIFDEVERQHPYSVWATKAQLMQAYVMYQANKYDEAISAADRFIALHPGNRDAAYAYYIKAISYYEQIVDVGRDQKNTENALKALQDVVTRFPDSKYSRDSRLKIDLTRDHLAGKQMEIGRYYERQGLYVAAINRYKVIVKDYPTTTHAPEALARLTECYTAVGLPEEAQKNAAVLGYNFPENAWYQDSYDLIKGDRAGPSIEHDWVTALADYLNPF